MVTGTLIVISIISTIVLGGLLSLPLYFQIKNIKKTKKEVEDRNACLHVVYSVPYRQKDGKELIIFMEPNGRIKNGITIGVRCRPDCFCKVEEYDERDMKFYAQLIYEGYYTVDTNYVNCTDWSNYINSGTIYEGKWKEYVKGENDVKRKNN